MASKMGLYMNAALILCIAGICSAEDTPSWLSRAKRQATRDIENVWTAWSYWSECSMTCGNGVRSRRRDCVGRTPERLVRLDNPTCAGDAEEYFICKSRDCGVNTATQREHQCERKNGELVFGHRYRWKPYNGVTNPCLLTCLAVDQAFYYNFGPVSEGTECGEEQVCVNAGCARVGCEGRVYSDAVLDRCRVCNGKNKDCMFWKGTFSTPMPTGNHGYTHVVTIPKGSTYVKVVDNSKNFIALKNAFGNYIINGKYLIDPPGTFRVAGTDVHYNRTRYTETITAEGPTEQELQIMVIFRDRNNGIDYEFYLPTSQREKIVEPSPSPRYRPRTAFVPTPAPGAIPDTETNAAVTAPSQPKREFDFTDIFKNTDNSEEKSDVYEKKRQEENERNWTDRTADEKYLETVEALYDRSLWEKRNALNRRQLKKPKPYKFRYTDMKAFQNVMGSQEEEGEDDEEEVEADPYDIPEPGMTDSRYDRPEPGMPDPYSRPEPGMPDPYNRPEPGMTDSRYDRPEPGMTDSRYDRPEPGMTDSRYDRPEPGMTDSRYDRPEPGMTDSRYDRPEPGMNERGYDVEKMHPDANPQRLHNPDPVKPDRDSYPDRSRQNSRFSGIDAVMQRERHRRLQYPLSGRGRITPTQQSPIPGCRACPPPRPLGDVYCTHNFAVHAEVLSSYVVEGERRYEMKILRTYRSDFDMLSLEYVWQSPGPDRDINCPCPATLTAGKQYIVVGNMAARRGRRESRLQIGPGDYVVPYSRAEEARVRQVSQTAGCDFL